MTTDLNENLVIVTGTLHYFTVIHVLFLVLTMALTIYNSPSMVVPLNKVWHSQTIHPTEIFRYVQLNFQFGLPSI